MESVLKNLRRHNLTFNPKGDISIAGKVITDEEQPLFASEMFYRARVNCIKPQEGWRENFISTTLFLMRNYTLYKNSGI